ncbi:hypothetical protein MIR68_002076 [Amoeboaphelidium protococcarum]|nr:hypothetical protein MIR68_002076 [Amoeboaphelidium protococcarum]
MMLSKFFFLCLVFASLAASDTIYFKNGNEMEAIDTSRFFNNALQSCSYHDFVRQQLQAGHRVIELAEDQDGLSAILNYYRYGKLIQPATMSANQWKQILMHFKLQAAATGIQKRKFTFTLSLEKLKKARRGDSYSLRIDYGNRVPPEVAPQFNSMIRELSGDYGVSLRQSGHYLIADNVEFQALLMNQMGMYASLLPHWFNDYELSLYRSENADQVQYFVTSAIMIVTIPYQSQVAVL